MGHQSFLTYINRGPPANCGGEGGAPGGILQVGVLRLRCAPLRMTLQTKSKSRAKPPEVESTDSHVWPKTGQTWGTSVFYLFETWATSPLVTLDRICGTDWVGVLRLRCAPLRMTLQTKSKSRAKPPEVESTDSHVWPKTGQTWGTNHFLLMENVGHQPEQIG